MRATAFIVGLCLLSVGCASYVPSNEPGTSILPHAKRVVEPAIRWSPLGEDPNRKQWYASQAEVLERPDGTYEQPQVFTGGVASGDGPPSWVDLPDRPTIRYRRYRGRYY